MKRNLLYVLLTLVSGALQAQQSELPKGNGKISGIVMDSLDNVPVQFATVALNNPTTNKPIDGTVADEKGKFNLSRVPNGQFDVIISFVGYTTKTFHVNISDKNSDINLGIIKFSFGAEFLKDVVVEGQRNIMEERVDRTVYNAENDKTTQGGDASDVLRRVPMLSVDLDGNVSMRGNSNVRVLINNKPSTIMASSIADALKQIPADQIKSVEVITSPSAKYDAEGSSGIINIITKKNTLQGLTLGIDAGAGLRGSNLGLNGNYRKGKMGFSLGGFGRSGYNVRGSFDNEQIREDANGNLISTNVQTAGTLRRDLFGRYQFGWDYEINKNNNISASVRYGARNGWNYQNDLSTRTTDGGGNLTGETLKQVSTKDLSGTVDVNLDYTHYFSKPQRELSFLTLISRNDRTNNFTTETVWPSIAGIRNENKSFNEEITFQVDYQTPIGTTQLVELGGKNISRTVSSDYETFALNTATGNYEPKSSGNFSNTFNYNQNVTAGYLSYTYNTKNKYSFKAGGRYEYTTINANFANPSAETNDVSKIPSYGTIVPSVNVSRKLTAGSTLKAGYNRRIQRPSIQFLNPNIQNPNPLLVTEGNPNLSPEFTDNYELTYNTFIKGTTLNFSGFFRNTTGAIQSIRSAKGDTLYTTYANIGHEQAYGLNFFGNVAFSKKFSLNGGVDSYYAMLNNGKAGNQNIQNSGIVVSGRLFGNYILKDGWGLQFFSHFRGRQVNLQGYQGGFRMYSLAIRKDFKNKKGSFGFGLENFVTPNLTVKGQTITRANDLNPYTLIQNSTNVSKILSFRVNVSYRIGKMSFDQQPRRKRSVNNDDLKEGGDGNNNGGNNGGGMDQQQGGGQRQGGGMPQRGIGGTQQMNGKPGATMNTTTAPTKPAEGKATRKKKKEGN